MDLVRDAFDYIDEPSPIPEQLFRLNKVFDDGTTQAFVHHAMELIAERVGEVNYVYANLKEIQAAVKSAKERRLLELIQGDGMMRARDDLGRAFSRGLTELRRQQQWRLKMTAIDVTLEEE